jgi:predicted ABC-type exoprotein transport system permease subunit
METGQLQKSSSWLFRATIALFAASTAFPIWAALTPTNAPIAAGMVDVLLAVALFALLVMLHRRCERPDVAARAQSFEACKYIAVVPLFLLIPFLLGVRLKWEILLPGLAWRCWYLVTVLPCLVVESDRRI